MENGKRSAKSSPGAKALPSLAESAWTSLWEDAGRRYRKTVGSSNYDYLYDGQNLIGVRTAAVQDYLFGPGIDEPLATKIGANIYYYSVDGLGSVTLMTDTNGTVQNSYVYDVWGATRSQSGSLANLFTYTSREVGEAGLMYYRARYYNPNIGRFVSEDPAHYRSAQEIYEYTNNRPVTYGDPTGLVRWECTYASVGLSWIGAGGTNHLFKCVSECAAKLRVTALVVATTIGFSASVESPAKYLVPSLSATFFDTIILEDDHNIPLSVNLEGLAFYGSAGATVVAGGGLTLLSLGRAHPPEKGSIYDLLGWNMGFQWPGVDVQVGRSSVAWEKQECCVVGDIKK